MNALDTVKLKVPGDAVLDVNEVLFRIGATERNEKTGEMQCKAIKTGRLVPGINDILLYPSRELVMSLSAKCLGDNYLAGISLDTLPQVVDAINRTGAVCLDFDSFFSDSEVLLCDVTQNVAVTNKPETLKSIAYISTGYARAVYPMHGSVVQTVRFQKPVVTAKLRDKQTHYDKFSELKTATNKNFLNSLSNPNALLRSAVNVIRVESNETTFAGIKKAFGISDTKLASVLTSSKNVNYERFSRIESTGEQPEIFGEVLNLARVSKERGIKLPQFYKQYGMFSLVKDCAGDSELIRAFLIEYGVTNPRRELKPFLPLISQYKSAESGLKESIRVYLDEYRHLMQGAVKMA